MRNLSLKELGEIKVDGRSKVRLTLNNSKNRLIEITYHLRDNSINATVTNTINNEFFFLSEFLEDKKITIKNFLTKKRKKDTVEQFIFQYMENLLNSLEKDLNDIITEKKWDKVSEKYLEKKLKNQYK